VIAGRCAPLPSRTHCSSSNNRQIDFLQWGDLLYFSCNLLPIRVLRHALHGPLVGSHVKVVDHDKDLAGVRTRVVKAKLVRYCAMFF
jgi:hypothetical protein